MIVSLTIFAQNRGHVCNFYATKKKYFTLLLAAHVYTHPKVILNILFMFPPYLQVVELDQVLIIRDLSENFLISENIKSVPDGVSNIFFIIDNFPDLIWSNTLVYNP